MIEITDDVSINDNIKNQKNDENIEKQILLNKIYFVLVGVVIFQIVIIVLLIISFFLIIRRFKQYNAGEPQAFFHFSEV